MQPQSPHDLLKVDPKDRSTYGRFSLVHLTAYSVHWLGLWKLATTYENLSVLNARLFPSDFGMAGFPELPDGLRTNRSLLQMRPKYRGFATSDPRKGVYLTERGQDQVARVIEAIGVPTFGGQAVPAEIIGVDPRRPGKGRERARNPAEIIEDRRSRLLFRHHKEGRIQEAGVVHLLGLLGVYDHTKPAEVRRAFRELRDDAVAARDEEFVKFLDIVAERFSSYLAR